VNEDMLFCKPVKSRASAKELFRIVDDFVKEKTSSDQTVLEYARMQLT
jgi:hypothetical protein